MWTFTQPLGPSESNVRTSPGQLDWFRRGLTDIFPGTDSSHPKFFTTFNNAVYFQATDGQHGRELWRQTDGLQSELFADLLPGPSSASPSFLTVWNNHLYFGADGTDTSWMVPPSHRDLCDSFRMSGFDRNVRFAVSDNTVWQPDRRYDCPHGWHWASTEEGRQVFTSDWTDGLVTGSRLWHAESGAEYGQPHGSELYTKVFQWEQSTSLQLTHESTVYEQQCGWDNLVWGSKKRVFFRFSDSAVTGAYKHAGKPDSFRPDIEPQVLSGGSPTLSDFAGIVCISDDVGGHADESTSTVGNELWRTDGTIEGTVRVADVYAGPQGSNPTYLTGFGAYLYFAATTSTDGRELWRTDGTISNADIVPFEVHFIVYYLRMH